MTRTDRHGLNNLWLGGDLGKFDLIAAARTDSYSPAVITVTSANADTTTTTTATLKIIHPSYEDCTTVHVITLNQANQQFTSQPCPGVGLSPKELVVAEGATVSYMVRLATEPSADVTVTVSGQAGTDVSLSGLTNNRLTFTTGNWDTSQTVTVTAAQDTDAADEEVTLTHTTTSTDADYAGLALGMPVTVDDDDTPGLVVSRTVLVGNSGQSGDESVSYSSDHGQAFTTGNSSNGYAVGSVTIISEDLDGDAIELQICEVDGDGDPTAVCTGLTPPDSFARGSLVFTVPDGSPLTLAPGTTYMVVFKAPDTGEVQVAATSSDGEDSTSLPGWSIRNKFQWNSPTGWQDAVDDHAIRIIISGTVAGLVVAEGATGTYTVALATEPSADVTVTVTISGQAGTDVSLDKTSLTFTTGNWDTPQTVTVTAGRDANNLDETGMLTHTAASTDADYAGLALGMAVTVNDTVGLVVSRTGLSLPEESVLVGNSGQSGDTSANYNRDHGQAFTTGNSPNGYIFASVTIISEDTDPIDLQICEVDADGAPTEACTDLISPDSFARGPLVFTVPDGSPLTLTPGTTYMVVFKAPDTGTVQVAATSSDGEDSTSLPGWSIRNRFQWNSPTGWQDSNRNNAIRIDISGTVAGLVVAEGATGTYTVALATEPSADVTVTISGQAGTDVSLSGLTNNRLTFTTGNWDTSQTVTVTAAQDTDEVDDVVTLTHTTTSTDTDYAGLTLGIPVTVDDDDTPVVLVSNRGQGGNQSVTYSRDHGQAFTTGNNSNGYIFASVTIISEDTDPIDLQICEVDAGGAPTVVCTDLTPPGSFARGPLVFTVPDGSTLTLTPGTTYMVVFKTPDTGTVRVAATSSDSEDSTSLPGWSIRNKFQWNSQNGVWQDSTHDHAIRIIISGVVIADDEVAGVTVVPDTGLSVGEGGTGSSYTVVLDSEPSGAVTVTAASADSGAVTVTPTVLTFTTGNWATAQTVTVHAEQDDDAGDESVDVSHTAASSDSAYNNLAGDVVTVTVTDDDEVRVTVVPDTGLSVGEGGTGTYTVVLDSEPLGVVTVTAASADVGAVTVTPPVSLTFTPVNWATAQTVTVHAEQDADADDESVDVSHTLTSADDAVYDGLVGDVVTVTVDDDDEVGVTVVPDTGLSVGEGGTGSYTVVLDSQPSGAVTVTAASADSGAVTVTPTVLTFTTGNWDTAQTVTVTAEQDNDADDESVDVSYTAASTDAAYNGLAGDVVTVTVTDNDEAGVTIVLAASLMSPVGEGGTGSYTVVLDSQPSGAVTVTAASGDSGAVTVTPTVLTFTPGNWDTAQTVTVTAVDDNDADDESVDVSHTAASADDAAYNNLAGDVVTVTVTDNDEAGVTIVLAASLMSPVGEGGTGSYTVVLDSQPSGAVTVTAASADSGAVTVTPTVLTFTTGNWDTAQTVTVTAVDDNDADDESVDVSYTAASTDAAYNGLAGDVVTVTVTDNDDAGVTIVLAASLMSPVGEGGTGSYTVVLDSQPSGAVTVTAASADSGAVTVTPTVLTFTTGNWDTAQTVTVTAVDDNDADDESVDVSHTAASSDDAAYNGLAGDVVTVTVTDNDDAGVTIVLAASLMSPVGEGGTGSYTVVLDSQPSGAVTVTAAECRQRCCDGDADGFDVHHRQLGYGPDGDGDRRGRQRRGR